MPPELRKATRQPMTNRLLKHLRPITLVGLMIILAACRTPTATPTSTPVSTSTAQPKASPTATLKPTATPAPIKVYVQPAIPEAARTRIEAIILARPAEFAASNDPSTANMQVALTAHTDVPTIGKWVYALVAPFPTLADDVPWSAVQAAWQGQAAQCDACNFITSPLRMSDSTLQAMKLLLGDPAQGVVEVVAPEKLIETLWDAQPAWGIVPFDQLNIRLKTLSIDGLTPLHRNLDLGAYPLAIDLGLAGPINSGQTLQTALGDNLTNRDEAKMSLVAMTGVTAMSRDFAASMDVNGVLYPLKKIKDWFTTSDIVHISNEVSFWEDCPKQPTENRGVFCSDPKYFDLLKESNMKIVELTGNHLNDYGWEPLSYTLGIYENAGIPYFGGGRTITDATKLVTLEDHGNKIGFVGCNPVGPTIDYVDGLNDGRPGSAPCQSPFPVMQAEISQAVASGTVVIATLQYNEQPLGEYSYETAKVQQDDFGLLADAGASVVSGSQGHSVQGFGLRGNSFIHYGVGNLYFDQMQALNLRQNFIDRYLIYDGRLLNAELVATLRAEAAQPRLMTPPEKRELLKTLFALSIWK